MAFFNKFHLPTNLHSSLALYCNRRILTIFSLGFASGIPFPLSTSVLVMWLAQAGIQYNQIGYMSLAGLPYAFKFLWSPVLDHCRVPYLTQYLGTMRAWLCATQVLLMIAVLALSQLDPSRQLPLIAIVIFLITILAASQNILMLSYQVKSLQTRQYGAGEAAGIFGYRMGMLVAGAGSLYLATFYSWSHVYALMSLGIGVGVITTLIAVEPQPLSPPTQSTAITGTWLRQRWERMVLLPFYDYTQHQHWLGILLIMFFYRIGDNLIGNMHNIFYLELGFTKADIANASKVFGMIALIVGGLIGGAVMAHQGIKKSLFYFGCWHAMAMLGYLIFFWTGNKLWVLYAVTAIESITGGMRITALFSFQMLLCNPKYAATQLSLMASLFMLGQVVCGAISGAMVQTLGWFWFFNIAILTNAPMLAAVYILIKPLQKLQQSS